jgi:hypothetical protein
MMTESGDLSGGLLGGVSWGSWIEREIDWDAGKGEGRYRFALGRSKSISLLSPQPVHCIAKLKWRIPRTRPQLNSNSS